MQRNIPIHSLLVSCLLLSAAVTLAAPEKILPKTLVLKPAEYYRQQADLWRNEVASNRSRAEAWLNLYTASVYAQKPEQELKQIVSDMQAAIPNSYEWMVAKGWNEGFGTGARSFLEKAYASAPSRVEAHVLLQLNSEAELNQTNRQLYSKLLSDNSQISSSLLNYSYNVLMSVEPSAVLITEGESTTVPLYVLQDVLQVRKDVSVLDLDLLTNPEYLQKKLQSVGLSPVGPLSGDQLRSALCALLPASNQGRKFYYALTLSKENLTSMKESLYVVGLASLHSVTNVDNVAQIRRNLEKEFLLDYLRVDFNGESPDATGKVLSANYLVPMILLYDAYIKEGKREKALELRQLMERIAKDSGKESAMARFLGDEQGELVPYVPSAFDAKSTEGKFRYFTSTLYAQESEVTNEQYNRFLKYLKTNGLNELYDKYNFDFSQLTEPALSMMRNYAADRVPTKKERYFTNYPAVMISYESALAYCDWLTEQYNHTTERKFKKVKFRLPTVAEWQLAAASIKDPVSWNWDENTVEVKVNPPGVTDFTKHAVPTKVSLKDPEIMFPWFRWWAYRNTALNMKGCWLGNFKVPETNTCPGAIKANSPPFAADGFSSMAAVESYFPNDIGLYDVVGNVAEMTAEKGKACGGSWNKAPEESTMRSIGTYDRPDATVGFRVFMEVVER
ncbi:MAG: SUMF1/EgtB/PvdO family nonheme iron enzyme [Bacteroidetes bacterium]|nr:SUMF1/EgtB/PvdO family nonheme iron enzyme [Bacteroidota bacterium]